MKEKNLSDNPQEIIHLTDDNFKDALKKYENLIVDFWAEWCMPCKMLAPIIEELAKENKGKVVFAKLNVDENPKSASEYGIMSIPTLKFFKNGKNVNETIGVRSKAELKNIIDKSFK